MFPFMQVGQVDFAIGVHMLPCLDHHGAGGLHKADGGVIGVGVQQPHTDGDVVCVP